MLKIGPKFGQPILAQAQFVEKLRVGLSTETYELRFLDLEKLELVAGIAAGSHACFSLQLL